MLYRLSADANISRFFLPSYNPRCRSKPSPCAFAAASLFRLPLPPKGMKMPLEGVTAVSGRLGNAHFARPHCLAMRDALLATERQLIYEES